MSLGSRRQPELRWVAYGAPAYGELRRVVAEAKATDALAAVTLVVPSNLCGTIARRTLAATLKRGPATGVAGITVLTLDRLAELIAAPMLTAAGRRPATAPVLAAAWRHELAADARCLASVAEHPATVKALVQAHRALRDLSAEALGRVAATSTLQADLVELHRRVAERLAAGFYDVRDLRATATRLLADGATPMLGQLGTVVLFLPQDLDRSASGLAAALAAATPMTVIAATTGDGRCDHGLLHRLEWVLTAPVVAPPARPPAATRVLHASDSDDETRCVVREVVAALREVPATRLAVLYANASPYARLLHEQLAAAGITVNGAGVRPTAERVLPRALVQLLRLASDGLTRAGLFSLMASAPVRDGNGQLVPVARWERISRIAGVVGGKDWRVRLDHYAVEQRARIAAERADPEQGREWLVKRYERDAASAEALACFVTMLQARFDAGRVAEDWATLAGWALETFHALLGDETSHRRLPEPERRAGERLERLLMGLAGLDAIEAEADLAALRQVLELELADDLQRVGRFGTGVLVAPLSAAVGLEVDRVFVVGLAEDLFPGRQTEDALLSDRARAATGGELPDLRDRLDLRHRHLLAALASASEVVASFPRGDLRRSSERLPSRWLLPSLRALAGNPGLTATGWPAAETAAISGSPSYATSIRTATEPATEQEWRQRAVASHARPPAEVLADQAFAQAMEMTQARRSDRLTRFDGNLTAHRGTLPDPADGARVVSPTALEAWVACPHGYFVQRILGVDHVEQPEELLEMSPADRGTLLHIALQRFFEAVQADKEQPDPDQPWSEKQRRRLVEIGEQVADEWQTRGATGHPTIWARDRALLMGDLELFLDTDDQVRRTESRRQLYSELEFGKGQCSEPITVPLGDGRNLRLRGSADRVDETADGRLVVVDYKSGKATRFEGLSESDPDKQGSKLQLPAYAYAARRHLGRPDAPVHAEYWFIGRNDHGRRIRLPLTSAVEQRYTQVLGVIADGIGGGLFPARPPEDQPWAGWVACVNCDPDGLGAKDRRDDWERKSHDPLLNDYMDLIEPKAAVAGR